MRGAWHKIVMRFVNYLNFLDANQDVKLPDFTYDSDFTDTDFANTDYYNERGGQKLTQKIETIALDKYVFCCNNYVVAKKDLCVLKNLNNMSRQFADDTTCGVKGNLTWAGIIFAGTFVIGFGFSTLSSAMDVNETGDDFKKYWLQQRHERFPSEILFPLAIAVMFLISTAVERGALKDEFKRFASVILKHYFHDAKIDTTKMDADALLDVADLIIANMSSQERETISRLAIKLDESDNVGAKNKKFVMAQVTNDITTIINSVFHRNNDLKQLCEGILNGSVKYKSGLFNNTQRTK